MSNAVSAVSGASFKGSITVADAGLQGMITVRGDLASAAMAKAVKAVTGAAMPELGTITSGKTGQAAWMSPDELFLLVEHSVADATAAKLDKALNKEHALAVNVSDARAVFTLEGPVIRDVLAKGSPANMAADALALNTVRRSRLGQLPVAFWLSTDKTATVICFRSVGEHVFNWLKTAAQKDALPNFHSH